MFRRRLKVKGHESISKNKAKSKVVEEVNFEENLKDLLEGEFIMCEYKTPLQMHPKSGVRDENHSSPWYFTHA